MRKLADLQNPKTVNNLYNSTEPVSTCSETEQITQILVAKYKKANLPEVVENNCKHLNNDKREELLQLLYKYEELFDGTLGDWKTEPVKLELKKDAKPFHSRPFQVPKIYVETLKK